ALEQAVEDLLLVAEELVERARRDPGPGGDRVRRGVGVPDLLDHLLGRVEDRLHAFQPAGLPPHRPPLLGHAPPPLTNTSICLYFWVHQIRVLYRVLRGRPWTTGPGGAERCAASDGGRCGGAASC